MQEHPQLIRRPNHLRPPSVELAPPPASLQMLDIPAVTQPSETVRYGAIFRRHRKAFLAILGGCILLSGLVTAVTKKTYRARMVLEVLGTNQDFMNNKDLDPNTSIATSDALVETQSKLLQSETVADRVVAALGPKVDTAELDNRSGLRKWLHVGSSEPPTAESVIRGMLGRMKVKAEGQSSLISVTVDGPTAALAAETANTLSKQYIDELQQARWNTSARTAEFLTGQLDGLRKKLESSEDALQDYAQKTGLLYTGDSTHESVDTDKLRQIQTDLEQARSQRSEKQAQLDAVQSSPADALPQVVDDANIRDYTTKLTDLRRQLADLRSYLTPQHYKVKQVEGQIAEIQAAIEHQRTVILNKMKADYQASVVREQLRAKDYNSQVARVSGQNVKEIRYNILKREVDANRDLYQSTLQKVKEASVVSAMASSNVRVVDPAKAPNGPYSPNLIINLAVGTLAGIMLSVLYGLLRERADESIRTPGQATRAFDIPELAAIPSAKRDVRIRIPMSVGSKAMPGASGVKRLGSVRSGEAFDSMLENCVHTTSIVAESFRSAVTSLLLWRGRSEQSPVIVVSSSHAKAGKTTAVFNLGLGLAESGRRVLLVDGDLRLPRLGDIFGISTATGLSDLLSGTTSVNLIPELIRETSLPGLFVLPSGTLLPNVTQLLHSTKLDSILERLRAQFDFILIDSPPLVPLSDARLLGQHADGMILICRAGYTSMEQLSAVQRRLADDGTIVIGTILNDWNAKSDDPSYLSSYSHYSRTGTGRS